MSQAPQCQNEAIGSSRKSNTLAAKKTLNYMLWDMKTDVIANRWLGKSIVELYRRHTVNLYLYTSARKRCRIWEKILITTFYLLVYYQSKSV